MSLNPQTIREWQVICGSMGWTLGVLLLSEPSDIIVYLMGTLFLTVGSILVYMGFTGYNNV